MSIVGKQPSVRFSKVGPYGWEGVSFLPKVITFKKVGIAGTENEDFWVMPPGTFVSRVFIKVDTSVNNSGVVRVGVAGTTQTDLFIDATGLDESAAGNWSVNTNNTTADGQFGYYFPSGGTLRLSSTGTATAGAVSGWVEYFEVVDMLSEHIHFDL